MRNPIRSISGRRLASGLAALTLGVLGTGVLAAPANATNVPKPGCSGEIPVGHGYYLRSCAYSDSGQTVDGSAVLRSDSASYHTDVRVWIQIRQLTHNLTTNTDSQVMQLQPNNTQWFSKPLNAWLGGTMVVDCWITESGNPSKHVYSGTFN